MNCNSFRTNICREISLSISKTSSVSGAGLPGAVFELASCNCLVRRGTTDQNGLLVLPLLPCKSYTLIEAAAPAGYVPAGRIYSICVDACGNIFVDGILTTRLDISNTPISASFTAIKVNALTGVRLSGAVYTLYMNAVQIATAVSDIAGQVIFSDLLPGTYQLVETTPPPGFQTNAGSLTVVVAQNGSVTIDGQPADGFVLNNTPLGDLAFRKVSSATGLPLAGATFTLLQNGTVLGTAVSDAQGLINFGIIDVGTYQLTETIPPPGYQPNTTVYQAVVQADGSVTINSISADEFEVGNSPILMSAPPVINTVTEEAPIISGTGVPGATVTVRLPDGTTLSVVVAGNGTWTANVPVGVYLQVGEEVSAVQAEPGKLISNRAYAIVVAQVEPFLEKTVANLTSPGSAPMPGDLLQFTILVGNLGGMGSVWRDATVTDTFIDALTFVPGAVAIDGQLIPVGTGIGEYAYNGATRTLMVRVGDLISGQIAAITLQTTVNLDATGEITNTASAFGEIEATAQMI